MSFQKRSERGQGQRMPNMVRYFIPGGEAQKEKPLRLLRSFLPWNAAQDMLATEVSKHSQAQSTCDFFNTFFLSISVFRVITACLKCALMSSLLEWKPSATVQDSVCYTVVVLDSKFTADAVIFIVDKLCNLAPLPDKSCCVSQLVSYVLLVS